MTRAASVLLAALLLAACSDVQDAATGTFDPVDDGTLTVGAVLPAPGFWEDDGGLERAIADAIADRYDLEVEVVDLPLERIDDGDLAGVDLALAELTVTDARSEVVDFSVPYLTSRPTVLVAVDGDDVHDLATAKEQRWAVVAGSTQQDVVEAMLPDDEPLLVADASEAAAAVVDGRADAALVDEQTALVLAAEQPELRAEARLSTVDSLAAALPKGSPNRTAVDQVLRGLLADGTIDDLVDEWLTPLHGADPDSLPTILVRP